MKNRVDRRKRLSHLASKCFPGGAGLPAVNQTRSLIGDSERRALNGPNLGTGG